VDNEKKFYDDLVNLIRWSSRRFSRGLVGRYDYWDFFEEGLVILSFCLYKWRNEKGDPNVENRTGFLKYCKTALFNRFRQLQILSHSHKKKGVHVPIEKAWGVKYPIMRREVGEPSEKPDFVGIPTGKLSENMSCDGGFGEIDYKELVEYVASFLSQEQDFMFRLMVDPPEDLVMDAIHDGFRKHTSSLIHSKYDSRTVKISCKCLHKYFNQKYGVISDSHFFELLKSIREVAKRAVNGG